MKINGKKVNVMSFCSTSKTSFRLAVCLEGIKCQEPGSRRCELAFQKCNEGLNVTTLPFKVKQKLSECSVDDILCHLQVRAKISNQNAL